MYKHFPDTEKLITPKMPRGYSNDISIFDDIFFSDSYEVNYKNY